MDNQFDQAQLEKAKKLASSPKGKQLLAALMTANPELMTKASSALAASDYRQMAAMLAPLLESEAIQKILRSGE